MRRRHQLRPDTFPFLAVLLCAMGSLILVLMELDRRARSGARERLASEVRKTEREREELLDRLRAEREAELERRRQGKQRRESSHRAEVAEIRERTQHVVEEAGGIRSRIDEATAILNRTLAAERDDRTKQSERSQALERMKRDVEQRRDLLDRMTKLATSTRTERERLSRDLQLLEEALARLKEQQKNAKPRWSVVPYVGKRGLNRRPLYVECDAAGLVFHPDRKRIGADGTDTIAAEVRKRGDRFRAAKKGEDPYWMLLVRPEGIAAYYQFINAVRLMEASYGYEFIDAGWEVECPDPLSAPPPVATEQPLADPMSRKTFVAAPPPGRSGGSPESPLGGSPVPPASLLKPRPPEGSGGVPSGGAGPELPQGQGSKETDPTQGGGVAESVSPKDGAPRETEPPGSIPPESPAEDRKTPGGATGDRAEGSSLPPLKPAARSDRDWVLIVDCRAEGVKLSPSNVVVPLDELMKARAPDARLLQTVRGMIDRRRGLQRPGDPPISITIRFLVQKDGLRAFHLAYPLLDGVDAVKRAVFSSE